jgi:hypothetical protein
MKKSEFFSWLKGFIEACDIELSDKKWNKISDTVNKVIIDDSNKVLIDKNGDGIFDGYDLDNDGEIDEYFVSRRCHHVWGDVDNNGELECISCGLIK